LLAFTEELALGQSFDLAHAKNWLASTSRHCLHLAQMASHRPAPNLLRELLFALADCHALSPTTDWVARAYRLDLQCALISPDLGGRLEQQNSAFEACLSRMLEASPKTLAGSVAESEVELGSDAEQKRQWQLLCHHAQQLRQAGLVPALPGIGAALLNAVLQQVQLLERELEPALTAESLAPVLALAHPALKKIQAALILLGSEFFNASLAPCLALLDKAPESESWSVAVQWIERFATQLLMFEADLSRSSCWPSESLSQAKQAWRNGVSDAIAELPLVAATCSCPDLAPRPFFSLLFIRKNTFDV
jgi:hypothetical protein